MAPNEEHGDEEQKEMKPDETTEEPSEEIDEETRYKELDLAKERVLSIMEYSLLTSKYYGYSIS